VDAKHRGSEEPEPIVYEHPIPEEDLDADAVKVIRRLNRADHEAYLVGGGVRDLLLGRAPKDYDVATSARPPEVRAIFRNCRIIGRRFRLAHILFGGGKIIETATFRRDPGADEDTGDLLIRHDNVFGEPFEDAIRRDFTINGLFYDIEHEEVIDYVGGMADVERHLLRMIGDPIVRFREDPVRILRAIKFSARLDLGIDPELYDAMIGHRDQLSRAAAPRVLEEICRLMRGGAAHRSMYLMWDTGMLAEIIPEVTAQLDDGVEDAHQLWQRMKAIDLRVKNGECPSDAVLLLALLHGPIGEWLEGAKDPAKAFEEFFDEVADRIAVPRRLKDRIRSIVAVQGRLQAGKLGTLPRRDFFADAATYYAIACESRGQAVPAWAANPASVEVDESAAPDSGGGAGRPRRRRRRR
jgi:poly(A) polymerase